MPFFSFLVQTTLQSNNDISKTVQVLTVILSRKWCLSQRWTLQPFSIFIATNSSWWRQFLTLYACTHVVSFPNQNHSHWSESETSGTREIASWVWLTWRLAPSLPALVAKAYAVGRALHLAAYNYAKYTSSFSKYARVIMQVAWVRLSVFMWKKIRKSAAPRELPCTESGWPFIRF